MSGVVCQRTCFLSFLFGNLNVDFESNPCIFKKKGKRRGDQALYKQQSTKPRDPSFAITHTFWFEPSGGY